MGQPSSQEPSSSSSVAQSAFGFWKCSEIRKFNSFQLVSTHSLCVGSAANPLACFASNLHLHSNAFRCVQMQNTCVCSDAAWHAGCRTPGASTLSATMHLLRFAARQSVPSRSRNRLNSLATTIFTAMFHSDVLFRS